MPALTPIILAGGSGTRLGGVRKALLEVGGRPVIERVVDAVRPLGEEVVVVDNDECLASLPGVRVVLDREPRAGALAALGVGLAAARTELCLLVASDMPFLNGALLRWLVDLAPGFDAVVPMVEGRLEPMHAVYRRRTCLPSVRRALARREKRMTSFLTDVAVRTVPEHELRQLDPELRSFFNINLPEDLARARALSGRGVREG